MTSAEAPHPQVKICGLTRVDEALACAELGADAIGFVFFSKSPRNLRIDQAREIARALPDHVAKVGVFVNDSYDSIMEKVDACGLSVVQLHGDEPPELVAKFHTTRLTVVKCLYMENAPFIAQAPDYHAAGYLVECKKGILPGGNALTWNWEKAKSFGETYPLILAGGLSSDNIYEAIMSAHPDGVDISSGVESVPGRKDIAKVKLFIEKVHQAAIPEPAGRTTLRRIF